MKRDIIIIDQDKCNGCGNCITGCPEGAIGLVNGKAQLVKEFYCDGLGACIGNCPEGAITIETREAEVYDEIATLKNIIPQGLDIVKAHLEHLDSHKQDDYLNQAIKYLKENNIKVGFEKQKASGCSSGGCPGAKTIDFTDKKYSITTTSTITSTQNSELRQWPVQMHLVSPNAPYFQDSNLLIAADCVPFAYADFHSKLLKNKAVITFCPKLDHATEDYIEKLAELIKANNIMSITVAHMEVPCCHGTVHIVKEAIKQSGKIVPLAIVEIGIKGEIK